MFALLEAFFTQYGYIAVFFVLVICGFGIPIPEDVTLVAGGVIAGLGHANAHIMFAVGMAGVLTGDSLMFVLGRLYGDRILKFRFVQRLLTPQRYAQVQDKFSRYGNRVLFVGRFLPGLRAPIFLTAGISGNVSALKFFAMDTLAALISVPVWIYLGEYGAENVDWLMHKVHQFQAGLYVALFIVALIVFYYWRKKRQRSLFFKNKIAEIRQARSDKMNKKEDAE